MKKRIVFFAHNLNVGGIETSLISLLINLEKKYKIDLILEEKSGILMDEIPNSINIKTYKICNSKITIIRKITNRLKLIFHIIKNYHKYDYSCCYVPYSTPGSSLMRYYSKNNSVWIHTDYVQYYNNNEIEAKSFFDKNNSSKFNHIFIVSNEAKKSLQKIYTNIGDKIIVCGNLLNKEKIITLSKEKIEENKNNKTIFLNVARHEEESKRLSKLIEAVDLLKNETNSFELWLIGEGKDSNLYRNMIKTKKLDNYINILGLKPNPYPYFKESDAFVLSSDYEGFPVVYLESLVFDLPIISTIPVSNNYFDIKDYAIICEKTSESIFKSMKSIINNKKQNKKFDFTEYNKSILRIVTDIIEGKEVQ